MPDVLLNLMKTVDDALNADKSTVQATVPPDVVFVWSKFVTTEKPEVLLVVDTSIFKFFAVIFVVLLKLNVKLFGFEIDTVVTVPVGTDISM